MYCKHGLMAQKHVSESVVANHLAMDKGDILWGIF